MTSSERNGVVPAASPNANTCRTRDRSAASAAGPASGAEMMSSRAPSALSWAATSATLASGLRGRAVAPAARIAFTATAKLAASRTKTPTVSPAASPRRLSPCAAARMVQPNRGHAVTVPSTASMTAALWGPDWSASARMRSVIAQCDLPALRMSGSASMGVPMLTPRSTRTSQAGVR